MLARSANRTCSTSSRRLAVGRLLSEIGVVRRHYAKWSPAPQARIDELMRKVHSRALNPSLT